MIGRRIIHQDFIGTVHYEGLIVHEDRGQDIWLGIEWDEVTRGRHNGTVAGHCYFTTQGGLPSGSLLKKDKVCLGANVLDAIFLKYFKEIPQELNGILDEDIIKELQSQQGTDSVIINSKVDLQQAQEEPEEHKDENDPMKTKLVSVASGSKQVMVEFDSQAFFETGRKKKKMVEFYGFNEIWQKINNLKKLKELSLQILQISSLGKANFLGTVLQNLRILSLESNLLYSWQQVFLVGKELKFLEEFSVSHNILRELETYGLENSQEEQKEQTSAKILNHPQYRIRCLESQSVLDVSPVGIFAKLKVLVIINMKLTWKCISKILPAFPVLEELVLCRNHLTDYENLVLEGDELSQLKMIDMEDTNNTDFDKIQQALGNLTMLSKIILNRNKLEKLCPITKFQELTAISFEYNNLNDTDFLAQLSGLPKLESLNVKHNPVQERLGREYVRQRAIAELGTLKIMNGSQLNKFERKDSEIFYLKSAFEQYFILKKVPHYFYDYEDFLNYALQHHPRIPYLIKKYGNPYEIDITVQGDVKKATTKAVPKTNYCTVLLVPPADSKIKVPISKKFMGSTGIFPIKQVVSKLMNIPLKTVQLSIKVDDESEAVLMDEKDSTLDHYGARDNTKIFVTVGE